MHKWMGRIIVLFFVCLSLTGLEHAFAMPQIMGLAELQPGMTGVARTVMKDSEIVTFDVEILGVQKDGRGMHDQILARASGPVVDETGGVIHGMSGSPVYVDGRVIGAVARGIAADTDPHIFYITPIEDMLKIWNMEDRKQQKPLPQVEVSLPDADAQKPAGTESLKERLQKLRGAKAAPKVMPTAMPVKTPVPAPSPTPANAPANGNNTGLRMPLFVSGFGDAGMHFLEKGLEKFSIVPYRSALASPADSHVQRDATLSPGSSVGVALVFGDFTMGATGTVTAVDGSRILAFGHPYTYRGNVNYFMMEADVLGAAGSLTNGTKIASFGNLIGRVSQDRYAGISGKLGEFPAVVPVEVSVEDAQSGKKNTYRAQIAYDEELLPTLGSAISYAALDRTIDRQGVGSAVVDFEITTDAVEGGKLQRSNMFYNGADVGPAAVSEIGQALGLLCSNDEKEVGIFGIRVHVRMDMGRQTASLESAIVDKEKAAPGETVHLKVTVKPYRQPEEVLDIPYTVPKNQAAGNMSLELRGGGLIQIAQLLQQQGLLPGLTEADMMKQTLAQQLQDFMRANKNNEIIITPVLPPATTEKEQADALQQAVEQAQEQQKLLEAQGKMGKAPAPQDLTTRFETRYIIDNVIHVALQVEKTNKQ